MQLDEAKQILKNNGYITENTDNYREIVTKKLAYIYDRCYDSDDAGRSYAEKHVADVAEQFNELEKLDIDPHEIAEVIWYMLHHTRLQGKPLQDIWYDYTVEFDPDFFKAWNY